MIFLVDCDSALQLQNYLSLRVLETLLHVTKSFSSVCCQNPRKLNAAENLFWHLSTFQRHAKNIFIYNYFVVITIRQPSMAAPVRAASKGKRKAMLTSLNDFTALACSWNSLHSSWEIAFLASKFHFSRTIPSLV